MTNRNKKDIEIYPDNKFMSFGRIVVTSLMLIFMGILTMTSFLGTTGMQKIEDDGAIDSILFRIRPGWESVIYYSDSFIMNIIWLVVSVMLVYLLLPLMKKIPFIAQISIMSLWTIVIGAIWIFSSNSAPSEDSMMVTNASVEFASGIYDTISNPESRYFRNYSFQLGYVFFNEILIRIAMIFGEVKNLLFLEMINVILLAFCYVGIVLINKLVFSDKRVCTIAVLLFMFSAQPIIFCSFLYGIIPGITFAVYGVLFMILYFKKNNIAFGILSAVCTALAVMIKANNNIVLVAVCCTAFVMMFKRKKFIKDIIYIVITVTLSAAITPAVKSMYENRANTDLGEPVPYMSWFLLGINEASNAPGWYNPSHTLSIYENSGFDPDEASEKSLELIKERVKYFKENPQYRHEFFYKKFISQWNETSYQSIWNNMIRYNYKPRTALAEWVCFDGEFPVKRYMDIYAQLIFSAVLVGLLCCLKNKNFLSVVLPLIVLGGMMYHLLAEAKSQYSMPYFILMIGFAAYGLTMLYDFLGKNSKFVIFRLAPADEAFEFTENNIPVEETSDDRNENEIPEEPENSAEKTTEAITENSDDTAPDDIRSES